MTLGELFAGVSGFGLGFQRAGFEVAWQVEIEPFARAVLATHFPNAERFEDVCTVGKHNLRSVDVICAGVPCQDVSVAGKRAGLAGKRTGLFYEFARILQELRPAWFVFENVPGLLSSNNGRDFAEILRVLMVECGYGVSWRVLNSQFFGVAQRRRRVFVVGSLGRPCPATILFEPESRAGNSETGGEAWAGLASTITGGSGRVGSRGCDDGANIVQQAISAKWSKGTSGPAGDEHHNLVAAPITASYGKQIDSSDRNGGPPNLAFTVRPNQKDTSHGNGNYSVCAPTDSNGVRDFTGLPKGLDSPRYRALGNAVTVQVAQWIGQRILEHEGKLPHPTGRSD